MTASLPNPFESPADEAGDQSADGSDERASAPPVPRPPRTAPAPRAKPAAPRPARGASTAKPKTPRRPATASRPKAAQKETPAPATPAPATPGPPPPLPADLAGLVVPPRPALPTRPPVPSAPDAASDVEAEPVVEVEAATPLESVVEYEAGPESEVAREKVAEPEPEPEAAPETVAEPEPDVAPGTVAEPEPGPEAAPETVAEPEPEPEPESEPVAEPEPVAEIDADAEPDDEPGAVSPEPTAIVVEPAPESADDARADAASANAAPALSLRGVTKAFGDTRAVDAIDLTVPAGSFYGLVGPNGAGKTTTLSMIAGLLRPDAGTISIAGVDVSRKSAATKRMMGVLPDRLRTFDRLTGRQLLYYYGVLRGLSPAVVESRTADLARAFDLTGALGRSVSDYSAGMTKKVMLAGAMIHSPRLLVLDEPFEAVDPVSSAVILDILGAYVSHGGTVILSSHGMELVERVCSGVAVIVSGRVLAEGTVDEVRGESTLEQRYLELAGGLGDMEGLEWLHTFSD